MKLKLLLEDFLNQNKPSMTFGNYPIIPKKAYAPIMVTSQWETIDGILTKTFIFKKSLERQRFIEGLLEYESNHNHHATITIRIGKVKCELITKGIEHVTELDREYAQFSDDLYRDIIYVPIVEDKIHKRQL